jgi:DNA polymerase I-like protein with 3'-5' exonuclease and polymerase domains
MRRFWDTVYPELCRCGWVETLLQVHDEMVLEFEAEMWDNIDTGIRWAFTEGLYWMTVPVLMEGKMGHDWGSLK